MQAAKEAVKAAGAKERVFYLSQLIDRMPRSPEHARSNHLSPFLSSR